MDVTEKVEEILNLVDILVSSADNKDEALDALNDVWDHISAKIEALENEGDDEDEDDSNEE